MKAIKTPTTNRVYVAYTEACFELTPQEISQIIATRKIYYSVLGDQIIPMMLHTESYVKEVSDNE